MPVIHYSAVCVRDIDAGIRFWCEGLGFKPLMDHTFEGDWPTLLRAPLSSLRAVFLGDPKRPDSGIVELVDLGPVPESKDTLDGPAKSGFLLLSVMTDLDAALAFEGETGPYLQYAVLRARNILARVATAEGEDFVEAARLADKLQFDALPADMLADHWQLAALAARTPSILAQAIASLELSLAAKHAHVMAQTFNSFYHRYNVAAETDPEIKRIRTAFVRLLHDTLTELLSRMGIDIPDRM